MLCIYNIFVLNIKVYRGWKERDGEIFFMLVLI